MARTNTPIDRYLSDLMSRAVENLGPNQVPNVRSKDANGDQVTDEYAFQGYEYSLLDAMASKWEIRFYDMPQGETASEIEEATNALALEINQWGATVAWSSKNIVAVKLYDEDGSVRPWMDLRTFAVEPSDKLSKRLAVLGWQRYIHDNFQLEEITGRRLHTPGTMTLKWIETDDPYSEIINDGISFMRFSAYKEIVEQMYERVMDPELREAKVAEALKSIRINVRMATNWGLFKGNVIIVPDHMLDADFMSAPGNCKPEFRTLEEGRAYFTANPEEQQYFNVTTNTQLLCHFKEWLWPNIVDDISDLELALEREIDRTLMDFREGNRVPVFAKKEGFVPDALHTQQQKFMLFERAGLNLKASLKLQMMYAELLKSTYNPNKGPETRKFPMERAIRVSLSSEYDAVMAGLLKEASVKGYEATVLHGLGLVVSDELYAQIAIILGGADKDDHVYVIPYIARGDDPSLDIKDGDVVLVIIRSPIGYGSNGFDTASEYWIAKATSKYARKMLRVHEELPLLDMAGRPNIIHEIDYPADKFESTPRNIGAEYSFEEFLEVVKASIGVGKAYGDHANLVMCAALVGAPLTHYAPEEVFIDVQQKPNSIDVDRMVQINRIHARELALFCIGNTVALDKHMHHRIRGLVRDFKNFPIDNDGMFVNLALNHISLVQTLNEGLKIQIRDVEFPRHRELARGIPVTHKAAGETHGTPLIITRLREIEDNLRVEYNLTNVRVKLNYREYAEIGNRLVSMLREKEVPHEIIMQAFHEAWSWCILTTQGTPHAFAEMCLIGTDAPLMHGEMIRYYIEMLVRENIS